MLLLIINKILVILYVLSLANVLRHGYYFIQAFISTYGDEPVKYILGDKALLLLGVSLAYVITGMITGVTI